MRNDVPPTRAEFQRLKADYDRLHAAVELLQTHFQRIAEMQVLDDERCQNMVVNRILSSANGS